MQAIMPDLWETETENPSPGLSTHAYLLTRPQGNILFYNTSRPSAWPIIEKLGGIVWQLLSHEDEVGSSLEFISTRFGSKLGIHEAECEAAATHRTCCSANPAPYSTASRSFPPRAIPRAAPVSR